MSAATDSPLLFVTGASRSGTTLMNRLLGNHSAILALRELHYFGELYEPEATPPGMHIDKARALAAVVFARQREDLWHTQVTATDQQQATELVRELVASEQDQINGYSLYATSVNHLARQANKQISCEQTPRNIFYAKALLEAYPNARVIHLLRDPRAVMASQKQRWQMRKLGANNVPRMEVLRTRANYHPITMSGLWNAATQRALELTDHPRVRCVAFEELTQAPDKQLESLCDWLGVDFEPTMLDVPHYGSSTVSSANSSGVSSAVNEQWRSILSPAEQRSVQALSGELMQQCGYTPDASIGSGVSVLQRMGYPLHLVAAAMANPKRALTLARGLLKP